MAGACLWLIVLPCLAGAAPVLRVADQKGLVHALCDASHVLDGAPYSIAWSEFPAAAPLLEALDANAVDTGLAGDSPFLFAYAAGAPVRALMALRPLAGTGVALVVPAQSGLRSVADLRGHLIGTTRGSIGHALALALLAKAGLSTRDVHFAFLNPADARAALQSGAIDAWSTWQPYIAMQTALGGARVLADGSTVPRGASYAVTTVRSLAEKPELLGDFIVRLAHAQLWATHHADEYAALYARTTGVPQAVAAATARDLVGAPVRMDAGLQQTERDVLALYVKAGLIAAPPPIEGAFDRRFEAAALP